MAINLTVALTDQEQALIQALALRESPGATDWVATPDGTIIEAEIR